jgi:hypothetical protein
VPQRLTLMHLWLQQALLYCCCLPSLVFPRRPVGAATMPMTGKGPLSKAASGCRGGSFWDVAEVASIRTKTASARPRHRMNSQNQSQCCGFRSGSMGSDQSLLTQGEDARRVSAPTPLEGNDEDRGISLPPRSIFLAAACILAVVLTACMTAWRRIPATSSQRVHWPGRSALRSTARMAISRSSSPTRTRAAARSARRSGFHGIVDPGRPSAGVVNSVSARTRRPTQPLTS